MSQLYRTLFGFSREPFAAELKVEEILKTEGSSRLTTERITPRRPGDHGPDDGGSGRWQIHGATLCGEPPTSFRVSTALGHRQGGRTWNSIARSSRN